MVLTLSDRARFIVTTLGFTVGLSATLLARAVVVVAVIDGMTSGDDDVTPAC